MSNANVLTPALRSRLDAVARRVRWLRILRGSSTVALALVLTAAAAMLVDYFLPMPAVVRLALFGGWIVLAVGTTLVGLVAPLMRRLDPADLAAVVEQHYPELAERLTTTVELANTQDDFHGSRSLIALLVSDTAQRTSRLDFLPAVSSRGAIAVGIAALAVLVLVLTPAVVWTREVAGQGQRFFFAWTSLEWHGRKAAPYDLEVANKDVLTACGRPMTFSVRVVPHNDEVVLPKQSTLVLIDETGQETRLPMAADRHDVFKLEHKVTRDGRYRIEAGEAVSPTYDIRTIIPVELAEDSPRVTITAPQYARQTVSDYRVSGVVDLSALKHSEVSLDCRFTRPAVAAYVEWTVVEIKDAKDGSKNEPKTTMLPMTLSDDRRSAVVVLPALVHGTYRIVLEAEHGIRTEMEARTLMVRADQPPQIVKFAGKDEMKAILPYDRLTLEITAGDDIGVARADLEFRLNNEEVKSEAMTLGGANRQEATANHVWKLAGKVKEGDEISYRIRVQDNLPKEYGGPQTAYYPADRWLRLKVVKQAAPLREQEILAQRDDVNNRIDAIKADLQREQRGIYKVRQESRTVPTLAAEQMANVKQLQQDNRASETALRDLAREAEVTPGLQRLAEQATKIADDEMRQSDTALKAAATKNETAQRDNEFQKADKELAAALLKLDEIKKANEKLALERLDQQKVETLADRQKQLAERAAELAEKDPVRDPMARQEVEEIKRQQAEVAAELQRLTDQSEALRNALDQARAEQARELSERAKELAEAQRELSQAMKETSEQRNAERFAELARQQQNLADRAEKLAQETRQPARTAQANPLKADEAQKAADDLKRGNADEALRRQEQAARDLEQLAASLERTIEQAKDPREAARQLARMQENLRQRVQEETAKSDPKQSMAERLKALSQEEQAIRHAAEKLSVPPQNKAALQEKQKAAERAEQAAAALEQGDPRDALARMDQAKQNLDRLADQLPDVNTRRQLAAQEVARLRQQQEQLAQQTQQAIDQAKKDDLKNKEQLEQKLQDAARQQAQIAEALNKLDAPNQEARREKAQEKSNKALADLRDKKPEEVAKSLQEASRELERLQQALNGQTPADEKAQELARRQKELAVEAARLAQNPKATPKELQELQQKQQQIAEEAKALQAPEATKEQQVAAEAAKKAEESANAKPTAPETQQQMKEAARKLDELARQMNPPSSPKENAKAQPQGQPTKQQTDQARQLAREQRDLQNEVRKLNETARAVEQSLNESPLGELAKQQDEIARQAAELAKNVGQDQGEKAPTTQEAQKAQQAAQQAANKMQAGSTAAAQKAGKDSAEALRALAQDLAQAPRGMGDPHGPDPVQQARQLAQKQEELNRKLAPIAKDADAQRAQQEARQQDLEKQTNQLGQDLSKLGPQMTRSPQAQNAAQQAASAAQQAQNQMHQASDQQHQGNQAAAQQMQQSAAEALDRASQQAAQASQQQMASQQPGMKPSPGGEKPGQAVQQAQNQMGQAQNKLNQGQPQGAQTAMQQAAQALQQAAQQMAALQRSQPKEMGRPSEQGAAGGGQPDPSILGPDAQKYAGKTWGELPGELQTKILQDMTAKYGDDYARMIKLYFEQIADTKKK